MLGVYIHNIKDSSGRTDVQGSNPFLKWTFRDSKNNLITYPTYDWVYNSGRDNIGGWIEAAASKAGR